MTVQDWLERQTPDARAGVNRLRRIVQAAAPGLAESIKWNAPSYSDDGADRVTLGLERKGGSRLVLHRGAAVQDAGGFRFDDPTGLARWPSPDRGVVQFADTAAIEAVAPALLVLIQHWIAANRARLSG